MNQQACPHGNLFPWIPPGTSKKTGNPYPGFYGSAEPCKCKPSFSPALPQQGIPAAWAPPDAPAPSQTPKVAPVAPNESKPDWEAKDRLMAVMGAFKTASNLYQGQGGGAETAMMDFAKQVYLITIGVKAGEDIEALLAKFAQIPF